MQLYLLFSMPLFVGHLIHGHREQIDNLLVVRRRLINGALYGILSALLLFVLALTIQQRVTVLSVYVYSIFNYYLIPVLFLVIMGNRLLPEFKGEGPRTPFLLQLQFAGFFIVFNITCNFVYATSLDQMKLLFLPLVYMLMIPIVSRIIWRNLRFEKHWQVISLVLYSGLLFLLPIVQTLYEFLREWLAWGLGVGLIVLALILDGFFRKLETDIQYRLNLEKKLHPLLQLFSKEKQKDGGA